ncbi:MAG TPA: helix-turn-helix domain-containing protein [Pyrinomonadaceae bacterium]
MFISNMLGVRRAGVGTAAIGLQTEGLIRYSRGRISVLKRDELEEFACECYQAVNGENDKNPLRSQ